MSYPSRAYRYSKAMDAINIESIENAMNDVSELKEELECWKDNIPENLQEGEKAQQLEDAMSSLDECIDALQNALDAIQESRDVSVEFPGMY